MPKCALPEHIDEPGEWENTDDDVWYMRWRMYIKGWFAFANRCPKGITGSIVFLPALYLLPFTVWFTGWTWWYCFPLIVIPVNRKWRLWPYTVFAIRGAGKWRLEGVKGNQETTTDQKVIWFMPYFQSIRIGQELEVPTYYLSRVQYWCRWHLRMDWPLLFGFHFYFKAADVVPPMERRDTDGKLFFAYRGWHRDGDEIFWGDGGFAGLVWK